MSVEAEFYSDVWKTFPKKFMARLKAPIWGRGTASVESKWCFAREVPAITQMLEQQGTFEYQGFTLRFGHPALFVHKIRYERRG